MRTTEKLHVISLLVDELKEKYALLMQQQEYMDKAIKECGVGSESYFDMFYQLLGNNPITHRQPVLDECKLIRRLLLDVSKDIEKVRVF